MLITIVYGSLETFTGQNYAELWSGELELSCRALSKSITPRKALAYHHRTSDMLIKIIYNNLEMTMSQNYAELSSEKLELSCTAFNKSRTPRKALA